MTFLDFRQIAVVIDVSSFVKPEIQYKYHQPDKGKYSDPGKISSPPIEKSNITSNIPRKPPHPYRYYKRTYWNNKNPKRPTGDGSKSDRA